MGQCDEKVKEKWRGKVVLSYAILLTAIHMGAPLLDEVVFGYCGCHGLHGFANHQMAGSLVGI